MKVINKEANTKFPPIAKLVILFGISFVCFIIWVISYNKKMFDRLENEGTYAVAEIKAIKGGTHKKAYFIYLVDGIKKYGSIDLISQCQSSSFKIGDKYLVVYLKNTENVRQITSYKCDEFKLGENLSLNKIQKAQLINGCSDLSWWHSYENFINE